MTTGGARSLSRLNKLYDEYWEFILRENPTYATYLGDHRYDDKLEEASADAYHHRIKQFQTYHEELESLEKPTGEFDHLNYELFKRELALEIRGAQYHPYLLSMTQQAGPHIELPQLPSYHPFKSSQDYSNYTNRLRQFPRVFEQTIANLKIGINRKVVQARVVVERVIPQLKVQIVDSPEKSVLHNPANQIPASIPAGEAHKIIDELKGAIADSVVPAYDKLLKFVEKEYLPKSRAHPGIWSLPNGKAMYAFNVRYHTTTNLTSAQIHQIGRRELSRISREIRAILGKALFKGTLGKFNETIREDRSNFYATGKDLLDGFKQILQRMDKKLPILFGRLPEAKYGFREIEEFRADAAPAAYYYPAPEDRSRPAYFYVNTHKPETRPKYTMEALAFHEAVPGHHLQIALQQELRNLPKFRRHGGATSFIEGWALYAESLGKEVGFYRDTLSDFGRLTQEAWRASRLVIDTGIHAMRWTREEAIRFLTENTANTDQDIVSEVDRYIAWPGQALAYKLGELRILRLRSIGEKRQKDRFDLRKFHDILLNDGALPLDLMEKKMRNWFSAN